MENDIMEIIKEVGTVENVNVEKYVVVGPEYSKRSVKEERIYNAVDTIEEANELFNCLTIPGKKIYRAIVDYCIIKELDKKAIVNWTPVQFIK